MDEGRSRSDYPIVENKSIYTEGGGGRPAPPTIARTVAQHGGAGRGGAGRGGERSRYYPPVYQGVNFSRPLNPSKCNVNESAEVIKYLWSYSDLSSISNS